MVLKTCIGIHVDSSLRHTIGITQQEFRVIALLVLTVVLANVDSTLKIAPVTIKVSSHTTSIDIKRAFTGERTCIGTTERRIERTSLTLWHNKGRCISYAATTFHISTPKCSALELNSPGQCFDIATIIIRGHGTCLDYQLAEGVALCTNLHRASTSLVDSSATALDSLVEDDALA